MAACRPPINTHEMGIFAPSTSPRPSVTVSNNYLTAWGFDADAGQFGATHKATDCCKSFHLTCDRIDPEMIVQKFQNKAGVTVFQGNLHVRVPSNVTVTVTTKKRLLREALRTLETHAPIDRAAQPVVKVLVRDCNLKKEQAEELLQTLQPPEATWRTVWQVHGTTWGLSGDVIFVKGAKAMSFDLPFGKNHRDRGVRNDDHDAICVELRAMVQTEGERPAKTNRLDFYFYRTEGAVC